MNRRSTLCLSFCGLLMGNMNGLVQAQDKKPAAVAPSSAATPAAKLQGLDELASQAMKEWKVPGVAIAVVHEGRVDWDKPVRNYLPEFQMNDPVASEEATPRDLFSHRSGLPRHDLVWYSS